MKTDHPRSSRRRYQRFVEDYRRRRLDAAADATDGKLDGAPDKAQSARRAHLREYLRSLWPYRLAVTLVFFLALAGAGLEMVEPLFMRYIIDRVLLNTALDRVSRLTILNLAGAAFVLVVVLSNVVDLFKNYRQRILNVRVMLGLRRALFERLLHLRCPSCGT